MQRTSYFVGIDSLRFYAAFLVLLQHSALSVDELLESNFRGIPIFSSGGLGVTFFFALSGFLITYLLTNERVRHQDVSLAQFYFRRMIRIWPVYFLVLAGGVFVLGVLIPAVTGEVYFEKNTIWQILLLYLFFLANLATQYFQVGLLFPLWSIAVEEQFYLVWPVVLKYVQASILPISIVACLLTFSFSLTSELALRNHLSDPIYSFIRSLQFYAMGAGAVAAGLMDRKSTLSRILHLRSVCMFCLAIIFGQLFTSVSTQINTLDNLIFSVCSAILILNVASGFLEIFLTNKITTFLGRISYGVYAYHMFVDYMLRFALQNANVPVTNSYTYFSVYVGVLLLLTTLCASVSFFTFEAYFTRLKFRPPNWAIPKNR